MAYEAGRALCFGGSGGASLGIFPFVAAVEVALWPRFLLGGSLCIGYGGVEGFAGGLPVGFFLPFRGIGLAVAAVAALIFGRARRYAAPVDGYLDFQHRLYGRECTAVARADERECFA